MIRKSLAAVLLVLLLAAPAACGGSQPDPLDASPLPSATAGSVITTFKAKITSKKSTTFIVDLDNGSIKSRVVGEEPSTENAGGETSESSSPPSNAGVSKGVTVEVPPNVAVTLKNGKTGTYKDIKKGSTVLFTVTDSVVTELTVLE